MKKFKFYLLLILILTSITIFTSCKKDKGDNPGPVEIEFSNAVGNIGLLYNQNYLNEAGQVFTVSKFKYYISNIKFTEDDGTVYAPESYFLIDQDVPSSKKITLENVPAGIYKNVSFTIGIDSARNCSGAQTGALDPMNGMFWDWNTGYIFFKLEGHSDAAPGSGTNLIFHTGGYKLPYNCIRSVSPSLGGQTFEVKSGRSPNIHYKTDILEIFKSPTLVDFTTMNSVQGGTQAIIISDNYSDMITLDHIHQ